jgi:hypothetical protein
MAEIDAKLGRRSEVLRVPWAAPSRLHDEIAARAPKPHIAVINAAAEHAAGAHVRRNTRAVKDCLAWGREITTPLTLRATTSLTASGGQAQSPVCFYRTTIRS